MRHPRERQLLERTSSPGTWFSVLATHVPNSSILHDCVDGPTRSTTNLPTHDRAVRAREEIKSSGYGVSRGSRVG